MYLGLVYTVAGFLGPLDVALDTFAKKISAPASEIATLRSALSVDGWLAWFVAIYAGPVALLLRSPFPRRTNIAVWYLVLLITPSWVNSQVVGVEAAGPVDETGLIISILKELAQPFRC